MCVGASQACWQLCMHRCSQQHVTISAVRGSLSRNCSAQVEWKACPHGSTRAPAPPPRAARQKAQLSPILALLVLQARSGVSGARPGARGQLNDCGRGRQPAGLAEERAGRAAQRTCCRTKIVICATRGGTRVPDLPAASLAASGGARPCRRMNQHAPGGRLGTPGIFATARIRAVRTVLCPILPDAHLGLRAVICGIAACLPPFCSPHCGMSNEPRSLAGPFLSGGLQRMLQKVYGMGFIAEPFSLLAQLSCHARPRQPAGERRLDAASRWPPAPHPCTPVLPDPQRSSLPCTVQPHASQGALQRAGEAGFLRLFRATFPSSAAGGAAGRPRGPRLQRPCRRL